MKTDLEVLLEVSELTGQRPSHLAAVMPTVEIGWWRTVLGHRDRYRSG